MPISRPLLITLVAAIVAVVGFYATQSMRNSSDASAPVIATAPSESSATAQKSDAIQPGKATAKARAGAAKADRTSGEPQRSSGKASDGPRASAAGMPAAVGNALDARKQVVLFLYKPGSSDDRATARAVASLRGQRGVAVFTDPIGRLGKYRGLVRDLSLSQAPAVVIVGKDRSARVVEGFIDPATLAQDVADAR